MIILSSLAGIYNVIFWLELQVNKVVTTTVVLALFLLPFSLWFIKDSAFLYEWRNNCHFQGMKVSYIWGWSKLCVKISVSLILKKEPSKYKKKSLFTGSQACKQGEQWPHSAPRGKLYLFCYHVNTVIFKILYF